MPRFFIDNSNIKNDIITINDDKVNHISNSLRYKIGDELLLCNNSGMNYDCTISNITKSEIECKVNSSYENTSELSVKIKLYQGIAKGEKMDNIIQKATELGIYEIIPTETQYTVVKLKDDNKVDNKITRWNKIVKEAAEQSERGYIPSVSNPIKLIDAFKKAKDEGKVILCYAREDNYSIKDYINENAFSKDEVISVFIGPEGGFDKKEIEEANKLNIFPVTLGKSILRTETASLMVLSIFKYLNI